MAILKAKQIRETDDKDLDKKLKELRLELTKEKGKIDVGGVVDNPGRIKEIKRTIARILTIKKEEKRGKNARSM